MAGAGAKKRLEENKARVATLRVLVAAGAISFLLGRMALRGGYVHGWQWFGAALTLAVNVFTLRAITHHAAPIYGPKGELLDGGADLSMKGACAYYHDLLYITSFVQVRLFPRLSYPLTKSDGPLF